MVYCKNFPKDTSSFQGSIARCALKIPQNSLPQNPHLAVPTNPGLISPTQPILNESWHSQVFFDLPSWFSTHLDHLPASFCVSSPSCFSQCGVEQRLSLRGLEKRQSLLKSQRFSSRLTVFQLIERSHQNRT